METKTIAKVNNQSILIIEDLSKEKLVPIRPICDALGVDFEGQRQRISRDEILSSTAFMTKAVGADGKDREMVCLPMKFVFGWLFTIDTSRVNEEAREAVITYKLKCYDVLYNYFVEYSDFVEARAKAMDRQLEIYQDLQRKFKEARFSMDEAKKKLNMAREITFDKFRTVKAQYIMEFVEEEFPELKGGEA